MSIIERLKARWARLWPSDEFEVECVGHMHKVVFNDGDVIVITVDHWLPKEQRASLEGYIRTHLGDVNILVLENGLKLGVLGMPEVAEADRGAD